MKDLETKFVISNNSVIEVIHLKDDFYIPKNSFIFKPKTIYNERKEALYQNMLNNLDRGGKLENYKSSKYYKYYCERLKEDHPELLI